MSADIWEDVGSWTSFDSSWIQNGLFIAIMALLIYCVYHAGSFFFLLDRVWVLFGGNKEFSDPELNKDWNAVRDMELFRYRYRIPVERSNELLKVHEWLRKYDIGILELRNVAYFYDVKSYKLNTINFRKWKIGLIIVGTILLTLTAALIYHSVDTDHKFEVIKTKQVFDFDSNRVKLNDVTYGKEYCESFNPSYRPQADKYPDEYNIYTACEIFGQDGMKFYKKSLKSKFLFGLVFIVILVYLLFCCIYHLKRCERLDVLIKKINDIDNRVSSPLRITSS